MCSTLRHRGANVCSHAPKLVHHDSAVSVLKSLAVQRRHWYPVGLLPQWRKVIDVQARRHIAGAAVRCPIMRLGSLAGQSNGCLAPHAEPHDALRLDGRRQGRQAPTLRWSRQQRLRCTANSSAAAREPLAHGRPTLQPNELLQLLRNQRAGLRPSACVRTALLPSMLQTTIVHHRTLHTDDRELHLLV